MSLILMASPFQGSDVFSFGVVLLELLTGRISWYSQNSLMIRVRKCATRGIVSLEDDAEAELLMELWFHMQPMPGLSEDMVQQGVDLRLGGKYPPKAAARVKLLTNIIFFLSKPFLVDSLGFTVSLHLRLSPLTKDDHMHNICVPSKILQLYLFSLNLR